MNPTGSLVAGLSCRRSQDYGFRGAEGDVGRHCYNFALPGSPENEFRITGRLKCQGSANKALDSDGNQLAVFPVRAD